jgi:hypothetical protein
MLNLLVHYVTGRQWKVNRSYFLYCAATTLYSCRHLRLVCFLRGTPHGSRKKMNVGRQPTGRLSMATLCCGLEKNGMVGAWHGHGVASVNQTWSHCVNQMGKTHSKPLAARHGMLCVNWPLAFFVTPLPHLWCQRRQTHVIWFRTWSIYLPEYIFISVFFSSHILH